MQRRSQTDIAARGVVAPVSVRSATTDTGEPAERGDQSTISSIHIPSVHRCKRGIGGWSEQLEEFLKYFLKFFSVPICLLFVVSCGGVSTRLLPPDGTVAQTGWPRALRLLLGTQLAPTADVIEVAVCKVPLSTTDPIYGQLPLRLTLTPADLASKLNTTVTAYFEALSHGLYHPTFIAGATLEMSSDETHDHCVERAIDTSAQQTSVVMVVGNAEHLADQSGGWGRVGLPCSARFCSALKTRRALYVGASDFHPSWGATPAVDLTEHEIGHTLGLPHSGDPDSANQHASDIDLMSNSAAPRTTRPDSRNGPDTLAINRVVLGWLPVSAITVAAPGGATFVLSPSTGSTGLRMVVLPVRDGSFLTVEYLTADGFNEFLPTAGVAVHRIDQGAAACTHGDDAGSEPAESCIGVQRVQETLGSAAPHLQLLATNGDSWQLNGWTITVGTPGSTMQVEVRPADG